MLHNRTKEDKELEKANKDSEIGHGREATVRDGDRATTLSE